MYTNVMCHMHKITLPVTDDISKKGNYISNPITAEAAVVSPSHSPCFREELQAFSAVQHLRCHMHSSPEANCSVFMSQLSILFFYFNFNQTLLELFVCT